ncbi:MAG: hypothetical protein GX868_14185 [Actinobacteria bacterium]|nr:hypothetical protein [Actinomycetota bacterium]
MNAPTDLATSERARTSFPRPAYRILELEVECHGDAARTARVISAEVNNSPLALARACLGDVEVYPVPAAGTTPSGSLTLSLRLRDRSQILDRLHQEELVTIVSRCARVLDARRIP